MEMWRWTACSHVCHCGDFFFWIISFGIPFVETCAYFLLLVVHLQEFWFPVISSLLSGHVFLPSVGFTLFFIILLKIDRFFNFSVCNFMFQPSNHIDDFLLYSFQSTYTFFEVEKPIQNTLYSSPWKWENIFLRRGVEGNNHFFDLLLAAVLVLHWRKCFHCAACWWWLWNVHTNYGWYRVFSFVC